MFLESRLAAREKYPWRFNPRSLYDFLLSSMYRSVVHVAVYLPFRNSEPWFTSIEEISLNEFFHAVAFEPHSYQPDAMSSKDWLQGRDLLRRQSTEGSSEPAQENDDALLVSPKFLEVHLWPIGRLQHSIARDPLRRLAQRQRGHLRHFARVIPSHGLAH